MKKLSKREDEIEQEEQGKCLARGHGPIDDEYNEACLKRILLPRMMKLIKKSALYLTWFNFLDWIEDGLKSYKKTHLVNKSQKEIGDEINELDAEMYRCRKELEKPMHRVEKTRIRKELQGAHKRREFLLLNCIGLKEDSKK